MIDQWVSCDSRFAPFEEEYGSCCRWRFEINGPKCGIGEGKCTSDYFCKETLKCGSPGNCKEVRPEVDDWSDDANCCYDPSKFLSRKSMPDSQFLFLLL